jgi:hypothetical protein
LNYISYLVDNIGISSMLPVHMTNLDFQNQNIEYDNIVSMMNTYLDEQSPNNQIFSFITTDPLPRRIN